MHATIVGKPTIIPDKCGSVFRIPWFSPDVSSITLFGPGVMEVTKQNIKIGMTVSKISISP
jgi:hypothetical protein